MALNHCKLIQLNRSNDQRGQLTYIEGYKDIPFEIKRIYYFHNMPSHCKRGGHAHKSNSQIFIPLNGAFEITLDDGIERKNFFLNDTQQGLYIGEMIWRELKSDSIESICLILASQSYNESDYIYDYNKFLTLAKLSHQ